jgi:hypothetical protein
VVIPPLQRRGEVIRITIENLNSQAVEKVIFFSGDTDKYDLETGKRYYTRGDLQVTYVGGKCYDYLNVDFDEFTQLMTAVSIGRYLNENIKPFKQCHKVETVSTETVEPKLLDFGGRIWSQV